MSAAKYTLNHPCTQKRFWDKVSVSGPDDCWEWQSQRMPTGYGRFYVVKPSRKAWMAHRVAWIYSYGFEPAGLNVCHTCDNPSCVNPAHLFVGTQLDNMRDCATKKRVVGPTKFCDKTVMVVRLYGKHINQYSLAKHIGSSQAWVNMVCKGHIRPNA